MSLAVIRQWCTKISDKLERIELFFCWILLLIMVIVVFFQVFGRYLLHYDLIWGPEVALFCLCWSTLLGASVAVKRKAHFVFDLISPQSRLVRFSSGSGILIISFILFVYGFRFALFQGARLTQPSEFKLIWYLLAFPVAGGSMIIYLTGLFLRELRRA